MNFKVGDPVEFELSDSGAPLWTGDMPTGEPTGEFAEGEVVKVDKTYIHTTYPGDPNKDWMWPLNLVGNPDHPGYVRLLRPTSAKASGCPCDSQELFRWGHDKTCPEFKRRR